MKFCNVSKYVSSLMSNSKDDIRRFVTGVSKDLEK